MTQSYKNIKFEASLYDIGANSTTGADSNLESTPPMALLAHGITLESAPEILESLLQMKFRQQKKSLFYV